MIKNNSRFNILIGCALLALMVSGCATDENHTYMAGDIEIEDPMENTNRKVFAFNNVVDDNIIHPVVKGYNRAVPAPARTGVSNVFKNLRTPVNLGNELLQGDFQGAGNVAVRGVVNTLLGIGGIYDLAGHEGLEYEHEDFGQTLATWGIGHGPYLVVPVLGPSSTRDYLGYAVDSFADPLRWYLFNIDKEGIYYGKAGAEYMNIRASLVDVLEDLEKSSIDYYAATRSAYYQRRDAMVKDQNSDNYTSADIPDYD